MGESSSLDDVLQTSSGQAFRKSSVSGIAPSDSVLKPSLIDQESEALLDTLDLRRLISSIDDRIQRREVELIRVVVIFIKSPLPLLETSVRQSLRRVRSQIDFNSLMTANVARVVDHSADIAALCVDLSQSHRELASPVGG